MAAWRLPLLGWDLMRTSMYTSRASATSAMVPRLPGHKLGRRWIFLRDEIEAAVRSQSADSSMA
jgi:hypothetical protein